MTTASATPFFRPHARHTPVRGAKLTTFGGLALAGLAASAGIAVARTGVLSELNLPPASAPAAAAPEKTANQFALSARVVKDAPATSTSMSELTLPPVAVVSAQFENNQNVATVVEVNLPKTAPIQDLSARELTQQFVELGISEVSTTDLQWILSNLVDHHGLKLSSIPSAEQANSFVKELSGFMKDRKAIQNDFGPGKGSLRELQAKIDGHYESGKQQLIDAALNAGIAYQVEQVASK